MYLSLPSVYFGFFCLQVSSMSNFCPDTGGKSGHLFRLTCSVMPWGGRNTANKYHWCVWGVLGVSGSHWVYPHSRRVCFPVLHCLGSRLLCWGTIYDGPRVACTSQIYATQVQVLGYSTKAQTQLGLHFVPYPGPSSSGDQVLGEHTLPRWDTSLRLPRPSHSVSLVCSGHALYRCAVCLL